MGAMIWDVCAPPCGPRRKRGRRLLIKIGRPPPPNHTPTHSEPGAGASLPVNGSGGGASERVPAGQQYQPVGQGWGFIVPEVR